MGNQLLAPRSCLSAARRRNGTIVRTARDCLTDAPVIERASLGCVPTCSRQCLRAWRAMPRIGRRQQSLGAAGLGPNVHVWCRTASTALRPACSPWSPVERWRCSERIGSDFGVSSTGCRRVAAPAPPPMVEPGCRRCATGEPSALSRLDTVGACRRGDPRHRWRPHYRDRAAIPIRRREVHTN